MRRTGAEPQTLLPRRTAPGQSVALPVRTDEAAFCSPMPQRPWGISGRGSPARTQTRRGGDCCTSSVGMASSLCPDRSAPSAHSLILNVSSAWAVSWDRSRPLSSAAVPARYSAAWRRPQRLDTFRRSSWPSTPTLALAVPRTSLIIAGLSQSRRTEAARTKRLSFAPWPKQVNLTETDGRRGGWSRCRRPHRILEYSSRAQCQQLPRRLT